VRLTLVLVEGLLELVKGGRDLQSLEEDPLLALVADVLGPLDEAGQVALGLDVATDSKVTSILLEQGALHLLGALTARHDLLALGNLLHLHPARSNEYLPSVLFLINNKSSPVSPIY